MDELRSTFLTRIMETSPTFFGKLVIDLLIAMSYDGSKVEAGQRVSRTGDGGIDGIINEDPLVVHI